MYNYRKMKKYYQKKLKEEGIIWVSDIEKSFDRKHRQIKIATSFLIKELFIGGLIILYTPTVIRLILGVTI